MKKYILLIIGIWVLQLPLQAQTYFPPKTGTWDTLSTQQLGFCQPRIDSLYQFLQRSKSKSFILLKDGKIVLEKYFGTFVKDSLWYWASAGKTLTGFAIGVAKQEGLLKLTDKSSAYLDTGWTSLPRNKEDLITIKHQITMTTGLKDAVPDPDCTSPSCLLFQADAGTRWAYHNAPYTLLDKVIEKASGTTLNLFVFNKISNPIGMKGLYVKTGSNNVYFSDSRSMARFGLLLANKGLWNGTAILKDSQYFKEMTQTSQNYNLSYGYLTWLNGKTSFMVPQSQIVFPGYLCPNAPADNVMALGKNGQLINVCHSKGYVWIRMGEDPAGKGGLIAPMLSDDIWKYINALTCSSNAVLDHQSKANIGYPNPVSQGQDIIFPFADNAQLAMYSATGQRLAVQVIHEGTLLKINTQQFQPGIYWVNYMGRAHKWIIVN